MASLPIGDEWKEGNETDISTIENCYCPSCRASHATTTMLPTKIPLFREIIVINLTCDDCGFRNSEINFGGEIQEQGQRLTLTVSSTDQLNRQLIKSDSATLTIPQLEFEIPATTQRGTISTIEGILKRAADNLEELQPERLKLGDVDNFQRCQAVIAGLRRYAGDVPSEADEDEEEEEENSPSFPFQIILDDPAGNSFIENPYAPEPDPAIKSEKYWRTPSQDMALGLQPSQQAVEDGYIDDTKPEHKNIANVPPKDKGTHAIERETKEDAVPVGRQEVMKFPTSCPHCHQMTETDMCIIDIPHFKEVIIMSMLCENCGYKSNEIKGGGAIPEFGTKITLSVRNSEDLAREVLKSDTAGIDIPELELELDEGGLDGLYTTIEGLLHKLRDRLEKANPFGTGDAARKQHATNDGVEFSGLSPNNARYLAFLQKLQDLEEGKTFPFTVIISDPLSNSFVGPVPKDALALSLQAEKDGNSKCYDEYKDDGMEVVEYTRTHDQNEILGLLDMKTEGYHAKAQNYGTDVMEELPDRLRRVDVRGPDHPHEVGMAPVEGDVTVMGPGSVQFAVPAMGQRGHVEGARAHVRLSPITEAAHASAGGEQISLSLKKLLHDFEYADEKFIMNDEYEGPREGMVYKDGAQGLGYYQDVPLVVLCSERKS